MANSVYTVAKGTSSAGAIAHFVHNRFIVEVMFVTGSIVICKVFDGLKEQEDVFVDEEEQEEDWYY